MADEGASSASSVARATALKDEGNGRFAARQWREAVAIYDHALRVLGAAEDAGGAQARELRCTLLCNRAAGHLQAKAYEQCVRDATEALALDPRRIKALYRRAQAHEAQGDLESALKDFMMMIHLEPGNKEGLAGARRVREALQARAQAQPPVVRMLQVLRGGPASDPKKREEALKGLVGLAAEDAQAAAEVLRHADLLASLLLLAPGENEAGQERLLALRLLAACCHHPTFVQGAFLTDASPALLQPLRLAEEAGNDDEESALAIATVYLRAAKAAAYGRTTADGDGDQEALAALVGGAVDYWLGALRHGKPSVREAGLDALLWWASQAPAHRTGHQDGVAHRFFNIEYANKRLAQLVRLLNDEGNSVSSRLKAAQLLGRLLAVLGTERTSSGDEATMSSTRSIVSTALAQAQTLMEGRLLLLLACFHAAPELGQWAVGKHQAVLRAAGASSEAAAQIFAAELLNTAASSEAGRASLGSFLSDHPQLLPGLMDSPAAEARIAAASAFTKLGLAVKALSTASAELPGLLNVALQGLQLATASPTATSASAIERAVEVLCCLVTRTSFKDELAYGSGRCRSCLPLLVSLVQSQAPAAGSDAGGATAAATAATSNRAWYGVAFVLASLTLSNDELRREALAERDIDPEEYEQLRRIQEMQAKKEEQAAGVGASAADDPDPPERVQARAKELVRADGVRALARLAAIPGAGTLTQEQVALALAQVATVVELRGAVVQQGGYNACLELAKEGPPDAVRARAAHALAKVLVTTNPAVLSDRQRASAVACLLWLCRHGKATNLQQFEALMALTNLAAADEACLDAIAAHRGISCFHSLQYSDHPLVRRAATEALCNMACHPQAVQLLRDPEKLRIWLALAQAFEGEPAEGEGEGEREGGDLPTARAAAGGLALASADEGVANAIVEGTEPERLQAWRALLESGNLELVHRAAVAIRNMAGFPKPRERLREADIVETLAKLVEDGQVVERGAPRLPPNILQPLQQALGLLSDDSGGDDKVGKRR